LKTRKIEREQVRFSKNANIEFVDLEKVGGGLMLRRWKDGDRFRPFGMEGEKKVSDLLIDLKVPLDKKQHVLVVADGEQIVWVCGIRLDDRYKVGPETRSVMRMELSRRNSGGQ
jgi:tRNA(Ile)-lysidine synthase